MGSLVVFLPLMLAPILLLTLKSLFWDILNLSEGNKGFLGKVFEVKVLTS